jgi:uncharacterized protein (UPF0303 family)
VTDTTAPTVPNSDPALLAELLDQEARLQLPSLTLEEVARLGAIFVAIAEARTLPVLIRIVLDTPTGPFLAFQHAMPGSSTVNEWWLDGKTRVVRHFEHSSFTVGTQFRVDGTSFEESAGLDNDTYKAHGGCFPLRVAGEIAGLAGISGLTQEQDHALVVEALTAYLG